MTISDKSTASSTAETITAPAGISSGDLIVLVDRGDGNPSPTKVVPTDFTEIGETNEPFGWRQVVSYKIANGSEGSSTITGMNGADGNAKVLTVLQSDTSISAVNVVDFDQSSGNSDRPAQTISSATGTEPLVAFGAYSASGAIDPRGMTPAKDNEIGTSDNILYMAWKIYNASAADVSVDMDDEGVENNLMSWYIEMTEGAGGGGIAVPVAYHHLRMMKSR